MNLYKFFKEYPPGTHYNDGSSRMEILEYSTEYETGHAVRVKCHKSQDKGESGFVWWTHTELLVKAVNKNRIRKIKKPL